MNPDLDLGLRRVIRAPRATVWRAWTDPSRLERWWVPSPSRCRVERLEPRPGGAFVTRLSDDGAVFVPHLDACFLVVDELERIVFTNAITSAWRPASPVPVAMTATVTLGEHPDGTDYHLVVRHGDPEARALHEKLGFAGGWGSVTAQLAALAEGTAA
ncbi:polyketide cyclase [Nonomuraea sp. MG754425]|uniref:SRPBCC domain-containing protein n=1 Tax=Nonomuraea sp. MG754425 TaxID=2570319 RepID=UPI001F4675FC|nr:SRPBCC domain-containing protein [Nonomuraea sp. MG754425]MCF6475427.1 polyketide cyclase [Nonomuraea sp. MG754425]